MSTVSEAAKDFIGFGPPKEGSRKYKAAWQALADAVAAKEREDLEDARLRQAYLDEPYIDEEEIK